MKSRLIGFWLPFLATASAWCAEGAAPTRVPWTTSRIHGSPDPPKPYVAQRIFPKLEFKEALEIMFEPNSKRWFALEKNGRILSWPQDRDVDHADVVADLKALHPDLDYLYGIAFHPKFAENRQVFITYTRGAGVEDGTKLSRFIMHPPFDGSTKNEEPGTKNLQLDPSSERVLLTWRSGGHNGANLQFGPDGMLYISTGDSEVPSPPDPLNTGQDISDLLSSILRIDVDHNDPGLAYAVPGDNPFIDLRSRTRESAGNQTSVDTTRSSESSRILTNAATKVEKAARGEVWAYGLRNPWKMSFDRATGRLWCGDVGWELWEMIHLIERGGNYGWSATEAGQPVRADAPKAPTPIRPPIVAHSHDEAASITGGYVYHGKRFPELEGAYIYGDWVTGKIWAFWHDGKQVTRREEIADTHHKIIAFGQDADGELLYLDYSLQGALYELQRNKVEKGEKFPTKLSDTGLFRDVAKQIPAAGVYPFVVSHPMWRDGAKSQNWIALPGTSTTETLVKTRRDSSGAVQADYKLKWPVDSVLAKTLVMPVWNGRDRFDFDRPIETQILHFNGEAWNGYTYRWKDDASDADLVPSQGDERIFGTQRDYRPSSPWKTTWRFHSRAECMRCHNSWCDVTLGFNAAQLKEMYFDSHFDKLDLPKFASQSQVDCLAALGLIDGRFPQQNATRVSADYNVDERILTDSLNDRARSYLHANCSHCHRKNAGGAVSMLLNLELSLPQTLTAGLTPQQGGLGLANPKLVDPGNPWNSVIALRIAKAGTGHMPIIGPHRVDVRGLKLVEDWIASMGGRAANAGDLLPKEWSEALIREKLATVEGAMQVLRAVDEHLVKEPLWQRALELAWNSPRPTVRDLFDRFLPDERRTATLGMNPDPKRILSLKGDAARGSRLLSPQGKLAACFACHLINGAGRDFGPDLSKIAARLKPEQILDSLLRPSTVIAQGYQAVSVEPDDGMVQVGFIVKESAGELGVKTATGQTVTIQKSNIAKRSNLPASLMPEGLAQGLTAQEAADLLSFLSSLK